MKIKQGNFSRQYSSDFFNNISDGILVVDRKLRISFMNQAAEQMLACSAKEIYGKDLLEFFSLPSDFHFSNIPAPVEVMLDTGKRLRISVSVSNDETGGQEDGDILLIFRVIPQVQEADNEGMKYKGLFENALEGILILNENGRIMDVNPAACRIYGFSREEFLRLSISDLFPHKTVGESMYIWKEFMETGSIRGFYKFMVREGLFRYIEFEARTGFIPGHHLAVFTDVTEKRDAERALRQSEAQLKAIFDSSEQRIVLVDLEYNVIKANKLAVEVSARNGVPLKTGQSVLNLVSEEELPLEKALGLLKRAENGEKVVFEIQPNRNMPDYWIEVNISPVYNESGKVWSICVTSADISIRKQAELTLSESEARFRSLVQNSSDLVTVLDTSGIITYASASSLKVIGYKDQELTGRKFEDLVHKDDVGRIRDMIRKVSSGRSRQAAVLEYRILHPEGYDIFVETAYTNLTEDPHIRGIVLNTRDVSERKFQEESLLLLERAIDSSDNGIIITDPNQEDNPVIYANKAFENITGYSYLEMIGKNCRVLQGSDTRQQELVKLRKALKAKKKVSVVLRNYKKDGSLFWNELNISPVVREGNVTNFIGVLNDVTERKLAEDTLLHITRGISGHGHGEFFDVLAMHLAVTLHLDVVLFAEHRNGKFAIRTNLTDGKLIKEKTPISEEVLQKFIRASGMLEVLDLKESFPDDHFIQRERLSEVIALPLRSATGYKSGLVLAFTRQRFRNRQLVKTLLNILSVRAAAELERDVYLQTLRSSEEKFRGLAENSPDLIIIVDVYPSGSAEIVYFNKKSFFGYKTRQLQSLEDWKVIHHPDEWDTIIKYWNKFIRSPSEKGEIEFRLKKKNGEYSWIMCRCSILEEQKGKAGRILVSLMDINERKKAENALRESEDRLRALIENTDDIIWSVDRELRITTMNFPFRMLFRRNGRRNIKPGELLTDVLPEELNAQLLDYHISALTGSRISGEFIIDGRSIQSFYEVSFNPIYSDEGLISGVSVFARNITERKKAENDIIRTNFELDSFVYRASHDLRAPLRSVLGLVNLVKLESQQNTREHYLSLVEKSVSKLDTFISDLTNFSRNSRLEIQKERIDFHKIIEDCLENLRFMENADRLHVEKRVAQNMPFYSDSTRIAIILQNLLSNSIKYQNERLRRSYCRISIKTEPDHVKIILKDNGKGIRKEYMDRIFNMFFRASEDSYGSGLGLYITKQVVEKLKGTIHAESQIGEGTTFRITLPNCRK